MDSQKELYDFKKYTSYLPIRRSVSSIFPKRLLDVAFSRALLLGDHLMQKFYVVNLVRLHLGLEYVADLRLVLFC